MLNNAYLQPIKTKAGERALLLVIILVGTALRVHQLAVKGFWGDEIWTAQRSIWAPAQIINFSLDNTVGPWTYLAGWLSLTLLGTDLQEFVLRWPSVIAGILTIPIVWALAHRLWGKGAGLVAAALVAASPYQVWYAQEARYYTWMVLFSVASTYFLYRAFEQPRRAAFWAAFSIATLLNVYNHPLSALLVALGQLPFCLLYTVRLPDRWARVTGLAGSAIAVGLGSLPLLLRITAAGQLNTQDAATVLSPSLDGLLAALTYILGELVERFGPGGWSSWIFLFCAIWGVTALVRARQHRHLVLLLAPFALAPLFFALTKYGFILRYVLFLQPLYLLLAARGVTALAGAGAWLAARFSDSNPSAQRSASRRNLGPALAAAAVVVLTLTSLATTSRAYTQAKPIDWRSLAAYLQSHAQPQDVIVARYIWAGAALRWYFDPAFQRYVFDSEQPDAAAILSGSKQVWLILPTEHPLDPDNKNDPMTQLDLTIVEDWRDPRLREDVGYFPVSELPASLYVGRVDTNWIKFAEVAQPNWTDRSYSEIAPGDTLDFSLTLPNDGPRELLITYFDHPAKPIQVSIDGQVVGVLGREGGGWLTEPLPVPDGLDSMIDVTITAAGAEIGGVSYAELRPAAQ